MKILFVDTGMGVPHAKALADKGHEVFFYSPWEEPYAKFSKFIRGAGYAGVKKIKSWVQVVDDVDFTVIADELMSPVGAYLKKHGHPVVSPGEGAELETKRLKSKKILESLGIKVPPYQYVRGVNNALTYLKDKIAQKKESSDTSTGKTYVKINLFRGDIETLNISDAASLEGFEIWCKSNFGPAGNRVNFLMEEKVEGGIETGFDVWFDGHDYVRPKMWGFEISADYIGKWSDTTPFDQDLEKLKPYLEKVKYTGPISGEVIINKDGHWWIDIAARMPYPLSYIYPNAIKNYPEALKSISMMQRTEFEVPAQYSSCLALCVDKAWERWIPIGYKSSFNKEIHRVGLWPVVVEDNQEYIVPYSDLIGGTIGEGASPKEALDQALDAASNMNIWRLQYVEAAPINLMNMAEELKTKFGIAF